VTALIQKVMIRGGLLRLEVLFVLIFLTVSNMVSCLLIWQCVSKVQKLFV